MEVPVEHVVAMPYPSREHVNSMMNLSKLLAASSSTPLITIVVTQELHFPVAVARRRNIPVALLWTMSASFFLNLHRLGSLVRKHTLNVDLLDDSGEHIPGISSAQLADLQIVLRENDLRFMQLELECISIVPKADCLIVNTVQELEAEVIDSLRAMFNFPIHPILPFHTSNPKQVI